MMQSRQKPAYVQRDERAAEERHKAQQHEDSVQIVAALNTAIHEIQASRDEQNATDRKNTLREWAGIFGIYIAAVVAIWAICSSTSDSEKQRSVMEDQWNAMKDQLAQMKTAREQTEQIIKANTEQLKVQQTELDRNLRPHVSVTQVWFDSLPQANEPLTGKMYVVNNGRRDARIEYQEDANGVYSSNFRIYWGKYLPPTPSVSREYRVEFRPCPEHDPIESDPMIAQSVVMQWCFKQMRPLLTQDELSEIISAQKDGLKLWAIGMLEYVEFKGPNRPESPYHFTLFNRQYEPPSGRLLHTDDKDYNYSN